ncbi:RNA 2',3'-cyclic phosphodiesterase [Sulfurovum sp.]|uniref:RNA 2',3'-cyclic phosphodiesterase n=1 Tax=Sulfurovum sp. TaxID=1969726 RepID=UPI0025CED880|nr:RNA 2',3'-cyclic phosphodiesterase [Sulfurovum sp.]
MRLFIASPVQLDHYASIKEDFQDVIEGTWVKEENLHFTWVFLGAVKEVAPVIEKLKSISALDRKVSIAKLGFFGRPPKIFFAKAEEKQLYEKAKEFKEVGFDLYRFKPHVTLCRIKTIHDYKAYKKKLKEYREKTLGCILPEINLYESRLSSEGAEYTCRYKIKSTRS